MIKLKIKISIAKYFLLSFLVIPENCILAENEGIKNFEEREYSNYLYVWKQAQEINLYKNPLSKHYTI